MSEAPPTFTTRALVWIFAVGILSFAGAVYFAMSREAGAPGRSAGANAFSRSALGHLALVETLRRLDIPVLVSRNDSLGKARDDALLVLAEPPVSGQESLRTELLSAPRLVLVLPKWVGRPDRAKPRWIDAAELRPLAQVSALLDGLLPGATLVRPEGAVTWYGSELGPPPDLTGPQLIAAAGLTPLVAGDRGILAGELRRGGRRILVIADPDLISNHGLRRGDNAVLAVRLIDHLRPAGGAVVFDETLHGFLRTRSFWRALFEFPFVLATIQAFATLAVLLWVATGRFGAPLPGRPPLAPGKAGLIDNTAILLESSGHAREIFRRYLDASLRDVLRRLHAPAGLGEAAQAEWLERVGRARRVGLPFAALGQRVQDSLSAASVGEARLVQVARLIYAWKQEILNGAGSHPVGQPAAEGAGRQDGRRAGRGG